MQNVFITLGQRVKNELIIKNVYTAGWLKL